MAFFLTGQIMWKDFLSLFRKPSAKSMAQDEYEECERQLLKHSAAAAYHAKIAEYYSNSIARLGTYIKKT